MQHRRKNIAAEANGGKLLSFTAQRNTSSWAAANVLRGVGNYWATPSLSGATTPYEFLIELNTDGQPTVSIDRLAVYNYGDSSDRYCSERFELAYSVTDTAPESFVNLIPGTLEKRTGAQTFDFPPTDAKYVKFTVLSGYDPTYWELDEIQIFRTGSSGVLVSTVKGAGAIDNFNQIEFYARNTEETSVRVEVRSGNVIPANDAVYTPWTAVQNGDIIPDSLNAKYIQYRAYLESADPAITPVIEEVRITTVGEYGNWAIPNVDIQGGTNTITAVAIDISDESVSDEALPIEVSLDVVDVVANRDKDAYGVNQDVAIDLDVTSPPATPGQALGERIFTAHLRIVDSLGFIVNADGAGNANYDILQAPFWVDESLPPGATYSETFQWTPAVAYRSAQSHTSSSTETLAEHSFRETSNALQISNDCRLVQYVYLDPSLTPEEIMLELITDGTSEHRVFWGANRIDRGVLGTPTRYRAGNLPAAGVWTRLEIDPASVAIEDATITGMNFVTYNGKAYWDRTTLGVRQFSLSLDVAESKSFDFVWEYRDESGWQLLGGSLSVAGRYRSAAQDVSPVVRDSSRPECPCRDFHRQGAVSERRDC